MMATESDMAAANLSLEEKRERIATIKGLLADYQAADADPLELRSQARLLHRLGQYYFHLGQWSDAQATFQESLRIYEQLDDRAEKGAILNNLGSIFGV